MIRRRNTLAETLRLIPGYDPFATAGDAWFDESKALHAIGFFHDCLTHVEGKLAGQPFKLEPWQQAIIGNLFGWRRKNDLGFEVRRYREALIYVPRKNGKTPLAAGICLYMLFVSKERGQQIFSCASDREQAALLYRHAKGMVQNQPELSKRAKVYAGFGHRSIVLKADEASSYRVLSADADTKHGTNSSLIVIDELHSQPDRELVDVLQTSMASANRLDPLMISITTADFERESICNEKHTHACKVRDGLVDDPAFLPVIYEASRDDDWTSPEVWAAANPNLDVSVSREYLERECEHAKEIPAYENTFKRLHLNIRTEQDVRWLSIDAWDACGKQVDPKALEGQTCYAGLDLSTTTDLSALALVFPDVEDSYLVLPYFWIPADNAHRRSQRDRVPYESWIASSYIEATPGNVIDYDYIRKRINELSQLYHIQEIAADPWNSQQLQTQLAEQDGFNVVQFRQGLASMSAPTKELEGLVLSQRIKHGGHPVLRWCAGNVAVEADAAGNIKPSKKKSTERIDGIVALIMAIGRASLRNEHDEPQLIIL